jgi:hypothetical protein
MPNGTDAPVRVTLVLGKFPVVRLTNTHFTLKLGGTTEMTISRPPQIDIRDGDLLTLYTEVLLNHANRN